VKSILIKIDGSTEEITPENGDKFSLKEMQKYVGGLIETVPLFQENGSHMFVNEEGLLQNLTYNATASMMAGQPLVGPAIVVDRSHMS